MRLLILIFALAFASPLYSQATETFDVATFQPPNGWTKRGGADGVQFSVEDKAAGTFCLISLFRSIPGLSSPKENFDAAWGTIVKESVTVSSAPQMQPGESRAGWEIVSGAAPFERDGAKGAAILVTASGYGKMVNVLVLTNTDTYEKNITAFLDSVNLKKLGTAIEPQTIAPPNGSNPSLANNSWKQGGVRQGMLGHSGLSTGSFSKTYQFFSNGTYKFFRVDMQLAAPKYYLENEEGTYAVSGNTLTITPKKASFSQHRLNKEEPPIQSGSLPLSKVNYRFEFWMNDGNWALLLSPSDGNENKRDGTFSFWRNGEPQRTYQYVLVDAKGNLIR